MSGIPVLMYHALEDADHPAGAKEAGEQLYILQTEQFSEQMAYLSNNGYQACLFEELAAMSMWPEKTVVLTFDDGHVSNYTLALPILQQYGFKAHFFITTGWIGTPYFLTPDQIKALSDAGMGIGSHGVTHRFLTDLKPEDARSELSESRQRLSEITGSTIDSFSAPGGRISSDITSIARETGYRMMCNSEPALLQDIKNGTIPRCALSKNIKMDTFIKLVEADSSYFTKEKFKNYLLSTAKKALGNTRYVQIRGILLGEGIK
jgi:peptidoglycan/xylan/chitin deacetylase (PgdA/CDA1 family)